MSIHFSLRFPLMFCFFEGKVDDLYQMLIFVGCPPRVSFLDLEKLCAYFNFLSFRCNFLQTMLWYECVFPLCDLSSEAYTWNTSKVSHCHRQLHNIISYSTTFMWMLFLPNPLYFPVSCTLFSTLIHLINGIKPKVGRENYPPFLRRKRNEELSLLNSLPTESQGTLIHIFTITCLSPFSYQSVTTYLCISHFYCRFI